MLIVDGKYSFTIEAKDDSIIDFEKAVGMAAFSNSRASVDPLVAIFESLWRQADLYKQLEETREELMHNTEELRVAFDSLADMNRRILKANDELKVHGKMQKEFTKIAAHELRMSIQTLLGVADNLFSELGGSRKEKVEVSKSDIEIIMRNARRLERLSSDILEVSRIESQSLKLNKENFDINNKIADVVADMRSFITKENPVKIIFKPSSAPLLVNADKAKIFQVISNILRNAIKFTEEGTITISSKKSVNCPYAVVTVKDAGTGIERGVLPRLFTKFAVAQGDNRYDTRTGSGLGLFTSRSIIDAHGGKIWAENNADGKGATFCFMIPVRSRSTEDNNA